MFQHARSGSGCKRSSWRPRRSTSAVLVTALTAIVLVPAGAAEAAAVSAPLQTTSSVPATFSQDGSTFSISTAGTDVWQGVDEYAAIYNPGSATAGASVSARVDSQANTDPWAKAGVVLRNSVKTAKTSPGYAIMVLTPGNGVSLQWDSNGNGDVDSFATAAAGAKAPTWVRLTRPSATTVAGYYSTNGTTWTQVGSTVSVPNAAGTQDAGLIATSHRANTTGTDTFSNFQIAAGSTTTPTPTPTTLTQASSVPATYSQNAGQYSISTAGADIWQGVDEYASLYSPASAAPGSSVSARVDSQANTDPWAKAGVVLRNSIKTAKTSPGYAIMVLTPGNGVSFQYDSDGNGDVDTFTTAAAGATAPTWVRLTRPSASTVAGYYSTNGTTWTQVGGTVSVPNAASTQDAGLIATSHRAGTTGNNTFSNFSVAAGTPVAEPKPVFAPGASPVMGWSSWNSFGGAIDYNTIKAQVDAFVAKGFPALGYKFINIDEGWWLGTRDAAGNITTNESKWPGGMKAIADYIHSKGLKAGIYTDAGLNGCGYYYPTAAPIAPNSGSEGHYLQDFTQFQRWGFDSVKVDWCGGEREGLDPKATFTAISQANNDAMATTGQPFLLSICNWGRGNPWNWAPGLGVQWRTGDDLYFYDTDATLDRALWSFDQGQRPTAQHTGYVNDPDMLTVGMRGLTDSQGRTEMNLWALSGAPLVIGANLVNASSATITNLQNRILLAVDQDSLGLQGTKVAEDVTGQQVYSKMLSGSGRRAVVLLNRTGNAATITARLSSLGLAGNNASATNVWSNGTSQTTNGNISVNVPANDSVMLIVSGTDPATQSYEAEASNSTLTGSAARVSCNGCSGGSGVGGLSNGTGNSVVVNGITKNAAGVAVVTLRYVNPSSNPRYAYLSVNGQAATTVAFAPTTDGTPGSAAIAINAVAGSNSITINSPVTGPVIDRITTNQG